MPTLAPLRAVDRPAIKRDAHQRELDEHARAALHARLDQLERERRQLLRALDACERAIRWLRPQDRPPARRRLRELGHSQQLDAFRDLHAVIEDAA